MKVLLADKVAQDCVNLLEQAGLTVDNRPGLPLDEKIEAVKDAAGLVVRSATTVDAAMMDAAPGLKVIGRAGSGVDNIDVEAATERGILVMNAPGENTLSAAEHAVSLLLSLCRNIPEAEAQMRAGSWSKKGLMGVELVDKTVGVIGLGRIGQAVAARLKGFGMRVLGYDPFLPPEVAESLGIELMELEQIWPLVDFLTMHTPLTERTRHLVNADVFAAMKPGVRIVNAARGGLIDEAAMLQSLDAGHLAGAGLDVFEQEPLPVDSPLRSHPKVICTPHLGASTDEAQEKVAVRIAEQMVAYLKEGAVRNAVNSFSVDGATAIRLTPWLQLAKSLGRLHAQFLDGPVTEIEIECAGDLLELPTQAVHAAVLHGFLEVLLSRNVNLVNATSIAHENGYRIVEVTGNDTVGFAGLLKVRVEAGGRSHVVAGSVIGHSKPKLVQVDRFYFETQLKGWMLFVRNTDQPGLLAALTAEIAKHGLNVANLTLGRDADKGMALNAVQLDQEPQEEMQNALLALDGVEWACCVQY
ncbi:MAG: phosphoglycerate dehydrogenase [Planctomycetota bacterium]|jgi:D-3-phosphoglycerate dehydrogenase|nr:phosphoglycerate dehydrogenase [Planctomycetota bacterium]